MPEGVCRLASRGRLSEARSFSQRTTIASADASDANRRGYAAAPRTLAQHVIVSEPDESDEPDAPADAAAPPADATMADETDEAAGAGLKFFNDGHACAAAEATEAAAAIVGGYPAPAPQSVRPMSARRGPPTQEERAGYCNFRLPGNVTSASAAAAAAAAGGGAGGGVSTPRSAAAVASLSVSLVSSDKAVATPSGRPGTAASCPGSARPGSATASRAGSARGGGPLLPLARAPLRTQPPQPKQREVAAPVK